MLAERWRQIESLFQEALTKSPAQRSGFLDDACSNDSVLRQEIESLLAYEHLAGDFLESDASDLKPNSPRDLVPAGERIGPYIVTDLLGAGGMGEVYKTHDERLGRDVAVKFLSSRIAHDAASVERFEREARAVSALNHPNICTLHDVGARQGPRHLVMELHEGQSLKDRMTGGPLPLQELASIAGHVCAALEAAHDKAIVHRDLKPANIFVTKTGQVKVLDFGLAKREAEPPLTGEPAGDATRSVTLTGSGTLLGTLAYMSPEQAMGMSVDARSDLFSLGVVLYEMATGRRPFRGKTPAGILGSLLTESPDKPSLLNPATPGKLDRVILKALEKDPATRYVSAAELSADLNALATTRVRRWQLWMTGSVLLVAVAAGTVALGRWGDVPRQSPATQTPRQLTANPPEDPVMQAALSTDGKAVAYGDFGGIHVRAIDKGETRVIPPPADYCFR
jgi:tRNA A-37 threonylcarbamoyl transferase component Bud32